MYSFGIVLWELWTGREPYEGMNYHALLHQITTTVVRPPLPGTPEWEALGDSSPPAPAPGYSALVQVHSPPASAPKRPDPAATRRPAGLTLPLKELDPSGVPVPVPGLQEQPVCHLQCPVCRILLESLHHLDGSCCAKSGPVSMQACWHEQPQQRPRFTAIVGHLKHMANELRPQRRASGPGGEQQPTEPMPAAPQPFVQPPGSSKPSMLHHQPAPQ